MSFFPVVILPPSNARLAKGPIKQRASHPWKSMRKNKANVRKKIPKLTAVRARAMSKKFTSPDGGGAHE